MKVFQLIVAYATLHMKFQFLSIAIQGIPWTDFFTYFSEQFLLCELNSFLDIF